MSSQVEIRTVIDSWRLASSLHAERIAITDGPTSWTYRDLETRVNAWVARLSKVRDHSDNIAIHLPHRAEGVAAMLGILAAGKSFVALDPCQPVARRSALLSFAGAGIVIGLEEHLPELRDADWEGVFLASSGNPPDATPPPIRIDLSSRSSLSFTSGSSGAPKAIERNHRTQAFASENLQAMLEFRPDDRHALLAPLTVGATHPQVFAPLAVGATLCIFEARTHNISRLAAWIRDERITTIQTVPSLFRALMREAAGKKPWPSLRTIKLGGEPSYADDARLFAEAMPAEAVLVNGLGLTEAGFNVCWHRWRAGDKLEGTLLPIGEPPENIEIIIEESEGAPSEPGRPGEIVVRSPMLPTGYWRDPAGTARILRDLPGLPGWRELRTGDLGRRLENGAIEHLGRIDEIMKIRGHRVNPAEIEIGLARLDSVIAAAVVALESNSARRLHAFVQPSSGSQGSAHSYRNALAAVLPDYMIPSEFHLVDKLPLLENGKIDRRKLSIQAASSPDASDSEAPRDALERTLHGLFSRALRTKSFGIQESFFDLGGDSLGAATLFAAIHKVLGRDLPLIDLERHPSVDRLAQHIRTADPKSTSPAVALLTPSPSPGADNLFMWPGAGSDTMALFDLARHLGPKFALHAVQHRGADGRRAYDLSTEAAASRGIDLIRRIQPKGPYALCGTSFGGIIALEVARKLRALGESVEFLALLDTYAPGYPRPRAHLSVRNRAALWLRSLRPIGRKDDPGFEILKTGVRELRLRKRARRLVKRPDEDAPLHPMPLRFLYLQEACFIASRSYEPDPYDGEVHLFRVNNPPPEHLFEHDDTLGWGAHFTGSFHVDTIPGRHSQHLREPFVQTLADKLRKSYNPEDSFPPLSISAEKLLQTHHHSLTQDQDTDTTPNTPS